MQPVYSPFWLAFCAKLIRLSDAWQGRDDDPMLHPAEALPMDAWLRLPEWERNVIASEYSGRMVQFPTRRRIGQPRG